MSYRPSTDHIYSTSSRQTFARPYNSCSDNQKPLYHGQRQDRDEAFDVRSDFIREGLRWNDLHGSPDGKRDGMRWVQSRNKWQASRCLLITTRVTQLNLSQLSTNTESYRSLQPFNRSELEASREELVSIPVLGPE